jgi:hypothetical protein
LTNGITLKRKGEGMAGRRGIVSMDEPITPTGLELKGGGVMKVVSPEMVEVISFPQRLIRTLFADIKYVIRVLISASDRFYWDNGFSKAASLAYSTLFALVPLTALFLGFLGSFTGRFCRQTVSSQHGGGRGGRPEGQGILSDCCVP